MVTLPDRVNFASIPIFPLQALIHFPKNSRCFLLITLQILAGTQSLSGISAGRRNNTARARAFNLSSATSLSAGAQKRAPRRHVSADRAAEKICNENPHEARKRKKYPNSKTRDYIFFTFDKNWKR